MTNFSVMTGVAMVSFNRAERVQEISIIMGFSESRPHASVPMSCDLALTSTRNESISPPSGTRVGLDHPTVKAPSLIY